MRTIYDEFAVELNNSFPDTPESFRRAVRREVDAQTAPLRDREKVRLRPFKALIPAAAVFLLLAGGTAAAAGLPVFQRWLAGMRGNTAAVEQSIVHMDDAEKPIKMAPAPESGTQDNAAAQPPFLVTDAYYDGSTLMFWVDAKGNYFNLGDHVYINGIDSRLEYVAETEAGSGIYECKVTIVDETLQISDTDVIDVKVELYTDNTTRTDYSFTVESVKLGSSTQAAGDMSQLSFGRLVSYIVTVSPSVTNLHLEWEVTDEAMIDVIQWGEYILEDASGCRLTRDEWLRSCGVSPAEYASDGRCSFSQDLEITGFDASSDTMTLIPVRVAYDEGGSAIQGSEEILEDLAFTISLTQ